MVGACVLLAAALLASACGGPRGIYHTVRPGENLYRIGKAYDIPYPKLGDLNDIAPPYRLRAGQRVFIPGARKQLPVRVITPSAVSARKPSPKSRAKAPPRKAAQPASRHHADSMVGASGGKSSSGFVWPTSGRLTSPFGSRDRGHHDGIDIAAKEGTAVHAAQRGTVIFADRLSGYGNVLILEHAGGFTTVYAHNDRNLVKKGARVAAGQRIATIGSTGRATAPHLHFEVRKNNVARNPVHYLPKM